MAKINHNNIYDTIDRVIENAKQQNSIHLYAQGEELTGDFLTINDKKLWHFATTGYLGLEQDYRLKRSAAEAIYKYGTQFPLSKTYVSHPLYLELERKMELIFQEPVIIAKNSTLAHMAVIPQAIGNNDAVILDHQVHWSVQNACQILKTRGTPVFLIRHNNMDQLEDFLIKLKDKHEKIWYMADGIYSMYGDHAPIDILKKLQLKYSSLHLYFDDVHGMSWVGERGAGFIKSHWPKLSSNMILISTLSKTFGASGATIICGDNTLHKKIKNFGGPLTFSAQLEPSAVAAAIAAADIHLSSEISQLQERLALKIKIFKGLLLRYNLPLISHNDTPVFYIGTGLPETAYNLVNRLQKNGYFVNPGIYPAVPLKNAGLRITISNHNDNNEIIGLARSLFENFPLALEETNNTFESIYKSFGLISETSEFNYLEKNLELLVYDSIKVIDRDVWNNLLGYHNALDYEGMLFVEEYFSQLNKNNHNYMQFKYYMIKDSKGTILALTHTSLALWKEDMLATEDISKKIELIRKKDPSFLINQVLSMGSSFTEGTHVFINQNHLEQRRLRDCLLKMLEQEFSKNNNSKMVLRDFSKGDCFGQTLLNKGYLIIDMPETAVFSSFNFKDAFNFESILTKRSKRHFREEVLPYIDEYKIVVKKNLTDDELFRAYELYCNVKENNLAINNFSYDIGIFKNMSLSNNWEFLIAKDVTDDLVLGIVFCYKNSTNKSFNPLLIGMENLGVNRLKLYRQLLFQTILHTKKINYDKVFFGVSATFEKRKLGADIIKKEAYVQLMDHFVTDELENFY